MAGYRRISDYMRTIFPGKVQKIAVNAGLGCPGRCSYCNNAAFTPRYAGSGDSIIEQIAKGISFFSSKGEPYGYLAFFQSYTNTYGDTARLISLYEEALSYPGVLGLVIATRPDCLPDDLMDWLETKFGSKAPKGHPYLLVEIGAESTIDSTLERINRGHSWECTRKAIIELDRRGIDVGAHLIIGLPGETEEDFLTHARRISELPVRTLKLHQLQIIKGTPMADQWMKDSSTFDLLTPERYAGILARMLPEIRVDIALDRFVSEAPKGMVLAPCWGLKPTEFDAVLNQAMSSSMTKTNLAPEV